MFCIREVCCARKHFSLCFTSKADRLFSLWIYLLLYIRVWECVKLPRGRGWKPKFWGSGRDCSLATITIRGRRGWGIAMHCFPRKGLMLRFPNFSIHGTCCSDYLFFAPPLHTTSDGRNYCDTLMLCRFAEQEILGKNNVLHPRSMEGARFIIQFTFLKIRRLRFLYESRIDSQFSLCIYL